jgi:hypothetical protein
LPVENVKRIQMPHEVDQVNELQELEKKLEDILRKGDELFIKRESIIREEKSSEEMKLALLKLLNAELTCLVEQQKMIGNRIVEEQKIIGAMRVEKDQKMIGKRIQEEKRINEEKRIDNEKRIDEDVQEVKRIGKALFSKSNNLS